MIWWDLRTDRFVRGQWVRLVIRPDECSLSPDGEAFCYSGGLFKSGQQARAGWARYRRKHGISPVYAVVCRPPYFSAVALWEVPSYAPGLVSFGAGYDLASRTAGGGYWVSAAHLQLGAAYLHPQAKGTPPPDDVRVELCGPPHQSLARDAASTDERILWHMPPAAPAGTAAAARERGVPIATGTKRGEKQSGADGAWSVGGRVFYAEGGRLYEVSAAADQPGEPIASRSSRASKLLLDCDGDEFVQLKPPSWATLWPTQRGGGRPSHFAA